MATAKILEGYFTPAQLAEELDVSLRTVQRWDAQRIGPIPTVIGKRKIYGPDDVAAWLKARRRIVNRSKRRRK